MHTEQLKSILKAYYERILNLEDKKYDVEYIVKRKDVEVQLTLHNKTLKTKLIQNITKLNKQTKQTPNKQIY